MWYKDAYDLVVEVNDYAEKIKTDHFNNDHLVQILLNSIVTGENVPFNKKK